MTYKPEYNRAYKLKNAETIKAKNAAYYAENREKVYLAKRADIIAKARERYAADPGLRKRIVSAHNERRRKANAEKFERFIEAVKNRSERQCANQ